MSTTELEAAGITDPALRDAYTQCRALNAVHGRTYFLATRLLAPAQRPAIHALYGFARMADDVVDDPDADASPAAVAARLEEVRARMRRGLAGTDPRTLVTEGEPVVAALADTVARFGIEHRHLEDFMDSMAMDLTVTDYPTFDDLAGYVHGSAAVIGLQVLPVLGTVGPQEEAEPYAADLGVAFQVTNFLRDVGEDLDRGRVYLPAAELAAFGVDRDLLAWCRTTGRTDPRVRRALAHLVARTRAVYRRAERGIALLHPVSRPCVRTAHVLYGGILDEIVDADYDVLHRRVAVGQRAPRRGGPAAPGPRCRHPVATAARGVTLVLAVDAACARCRAVGTTVADTVGPDLEVLPLADYRVTAWCAESGVAGDAPTLLEITPTDGDDRVRAWTGPALAPALVRRLGVRRAARLTAALRRHGLLGEALSGLSPFRTPSPGRDA